MPRRASRSRLRFLLALSAIFLASCGGGETASAASPSSTLAVRLADPDPALERAIREGSFFRWALQQLPEWRVEVGREAAGEVEIVVDRFPATAETLRRLRGLPVDLGRGLVFAGTSYDPALHALALRLPETRRTTWVLLGGATEPLAELTNDLLFQLTGGRGSAGAGPDFDYLVREARWLERRGRWRAVTPPLRPRGRVESEGGLQKGEKLRPWWRVGWRARLARGERRWEVDPASDRDDLAARDRSYDGLAALPGTRAVVLRASRELAARPEVASLAAALDRAAAAMAARVPVELTAPLTLIVEADFTAQGRHTGAIGEAVSGPRADLHLVFHPDDLHAYENALAAVLLRRAGLAERLPPWIARGAALWLAGTWYGRPWRDWLPSLAAAGALPSSEELLALAVQQDSSALLWTPAAAAVVDALPGATLREKLAAPPSPSQVEGALAALASLPAPPPAAAARPLPAPFLAGVSLAMANSLEGGYHAPGIERALDAVEGLGANAVSLMPFAFQRDPALPGLGFLHESPGGETDVGLIHAARRCRARGLSVLWKPHIWVSHESWPGEIEMRSEEDWARWWRGYRRYVLHHAFLARWADADLFAVGVELTRTLGRAEEWRRLIADVRRLYPGPLTYAGNWDGDLERAPFWDRLDLLGVDAYFPLAASPAATPAELASGAARVRERLAAAAAKHGKPVLLTEVGFAARRGAWTEPHVEGGELSVEDQARAYEALFTGLGRPPWLAGTYVWKVFSGPRRRGGGEPRPDFQLLGRPAEAVVRAYYTNR